MHIRFADVNGIRTRYYEAGSGRPLLLVHGGGAAADTWVRNIEPLAAAGYRVLALDLIGHGFSDAIDLTGKVPQVEQARHIAIFLDHLGIDRIALVGHSFGGLVTSLFYLADPGRVAMMGLISSSSTFHQPKDFGTAVGNAYDNQIKALENPSLEALRARNVGSNFNKQDTFEEILLTQLTYMGLPDRKTAFVQMHYGLLASADSREHRVSHRLEDIACPTIVITGREDPRAKWAVVQEGAAKLPDGEFHLIEQSGHKPYSEQAPTFNRLMIDYLARRYPALGAALTAA